jgi:steroid delta-isomerase-like uncharacterized protein
MARTQTEQNLRLWMEHVLAENRRDLERLIDTLAEEAVYEIVPTGKAWRGKEEIREFYHMLWEAMPDVKLDLRNRVADERYVVEESHVHGTHTGPLFGILPSGRHIEFDLVIFFPFENGRIMGERLYLDVQSIVGQASEAPLPNAS